MAVRHSTNWQTDRGTIIGVHTARQTHTRTQSVRQKRTDKHPSRLACIIQNVVMLGTIVKSLGCVLLLSMFLLFFRVNPLKLYRPWMTGSSHPTKPSRSQTKLMN